MYGFENLMLIVNTSEHYLDMTIKVDIKGTVYIMGNSITDTLIEYD